MFTHGGFGILNHIPKQYIDKGSVAVTVAVCVSDK